MLIKNLNIVLEYIFLFLLLSCQNNDISAINSNIVSESNAGLISCEPVSNRIGNTRDKVTATNFGLLLMGGGKDVDQALKWMIQKSGGGDFVVIRASGTDAYNDYIYNELGGVNSVETIIIDSREKAECPSVAEKIKNAEALFIAGGDQANYYTYWKNTALQKSIEYLVNKKKAPVGGTSAGMAILGEIVYTAENGSVTSEEALKNPFDKYITLKNDFLSVPLMQGIITDTHFSPRDRQGRLISFMAQAIKNKMVNNFNNLKGIGVDENTAAAIDENGNARIFGTAGAWFFRAFNGEAENCTANYPLTWNKDKKALMVNQLNGTEKAINSFNIINWKLSAGEQLIFSSYVINGSLFFNKI